MSNHFFVPVLATWIALILAFSANIIPPSTILMMIA